MYELKKVCRVKKKEEKRLLSVSQFLRYFPLTKFLTDLVRTMSR